MQTIARLHLPYDSGLILCEVNWVVSTTETTGYTHTQEMVHQLHGEEKLTVSKIFNKFHAYFGSAYSWQHGPHRNNRFYYCVFSRCRENRVSTELFLSNGCCIVACLHRCYLTMGLYVTIGLCYHCHYPTFVYLTNEIPGAKTVQLILWVMNERAVCCFSASCLLCI